MTEWLDIKYPSISKLLAPVLFLRMPFSQINKKQAGAEQLPVYLLFNILKVHVALPVFVTNHAPIPPIGWYGPLKCPPNFSPVIKRWKDDILSSKRLLFCQKSAIYLPVFFKIVSFKGTDNTGLASRLARQKSSCGFPENNV